MTTKNITHAKTEALAVAATQGGAMTLQARVSLALADRLDALVMRLQDEHPSRRIGRSEIIRAALLRFLDDADT